MAAAKCEVDRIGILRVLMWPSGADTYTQISSGGSDLSAYLPFQGFLQRTLPSGPIFAAIPFLLLFQGKPCMMQLSLMSAKLFCQRPGLHGIHGLVCSLLFAGWRKFVWPPWSSGRVSALCCRLLGGAFDFRCRGKEECAQLK